LAVWQLGKIFVVVESWHWSGCFLCVVSWILPWVGWTIKVASWRCGE